MSDNEPKIGEAEAALNALRDRLESLDIECLLGGELAAIQAELDTLRGN